jgi:glyoxylase I family protein
MVFSHVALSCKDQKATERFYTQYFGFRRAAVFDIGGGNQLIFIKSGNVYLELFPGAEDRQGAAPTADGGNAQGVRHIAFQVEDADATIAAMGDAAKITLGPLDFDGFIPGWRTYWLADPDGNIVEVSQGFKDQANPPAFES